MRPAERSEEINALSTVGAKPDRWTRSPLFNHHVMADPNPYVDAGVQLANTAANVAAQANLNRKTRKWNEMMYEKQKADNIAFWEMNNAYNSPQARVNRAVEAGISPFSEFGQGSTASAPNVPNAEPYRPHLPDINLPAIADSYYNIKSKQQQISNDKIVGANLVMQNQLMQSQLDDLNATKESRHRGIFGANEKQYQGAILEGVNRMLMENLTGQSYSLGNKGVSSLQIGDENSNYLLKNWLSKAKGVDLNNQMLSQGIKNLKEITAQNKIKTGYQNRFSGDLKDMTFQDWFRMIIQGIQTVK